MGKSIMLVIIFVAIFFTIIPAKAMTLEEIEEKIERLEKENRDLKISLEKTNEKIIAKEETAFSASENSSQTSGLESLLDKNQLGGYGELHYNNLAGEGGAKDKKEIDFHRFVLFFNHGFNDRINFFSELELEHSIAGDEQKGELELEQAFVDFYINDLLNFRVGLFLIPAGILNEHHEPPVFYGAERNPVEKYIIPATWWESGVGLFGEILEGLNYDVYIHSGLEARATDKYTIRGGRQKSSEADADYPAVTGRLKWTGYQGLEIATTYHYQQNITQGLDPIAGKAQLIEIHAIYKHGPFSLKALTAKWYLSGSGPKSMGADIQKGFYLEPSFKLTEEIGLFTRYNEWDNEAGINSNSTKRQWDFGLNYWPCPEVVMKLDYQKQDNQNGRNQSGINVGIGYQF